MGSCLKLFLYYFTFLQVYKKNDAKFINNSALVWVAKGCDFDADEAVSFGPLKSTVLRIKSFAFKKNNVQQIIFLIKKYSKNVIDIKISMVQKSN